MLNFILAILLIIVPWSLGAVLAAKISENVRGKLKHLLFGALFAVAINVIIIGYWIFILVLGGIAGVLPANTFMGPYEGYLPGRLDSFLVSFLGGYYWSRFLLPRMRERWEFVSLAIIPMIIWAVLALPSVVQKKAKEDSRRLYKEARIEQENIKLEEEKTSIRQDTRSCIFNSKKYDLPHTPYISCRGTFLLKFQTHKQLNKTARKRVHKLRNVWLIEWQENCEKNRIEDNNCDFPLPEMTFDLFENVNSDNMALGWRRFNRENSISPERTKSWKNQPHRMPIEDLWNNKPILTDKKTLFWTAEPTFLETEQSNTYPHFTIGISCSNLEHYQNLKVEKQDSRLSEQYNCRTTFAIFEGDINDSFKPSKTSRFRPNEIVAPVGVRFYFKANSLDEIASKFTDGQTVIFNYLKYISETYRDEDYIPPKASEK